MRIFLKLVVFSFFILTLNAQSIDKVEVIIGGEIVLTSDFESQYLQYLSQGNVKSKAVIKTQNSILTFGVIIIGGD